MESLHPRAQCLLENLRKDPPRFSRRYMDKLHGEHRALANDPRLDREERQLHCDLARAVEIRFRELDLQDLLEGKTIKLLTGE